MVVEGGTVGGEDTPTPCEPREPSRTSIPPTASHLPIHQSLVPYKPMGHSMALAYPALQLFYLLPGGHQGRSPALLPVYSSLHHGQPLFLPALTCGQAQQAHLEVAHPSQYLSEGRISKKECCVGSQAKSEKLRGEFFRPWENACSATPQSKLKISPSFRPWEEPSLPTPLNKDGEEDQCVTNLMKGMKVIGQ